MNYYENIMIIGPNFDSKEIERASERVKDVINKSGGEILKEENWGRKKLAYTLNKQKEGFYVFVLFKAPSSTILELERFYKVFDPVFKFLIVKLRKKEIKAVTASLTQTNTRKAEEIAKDTAPAEEEGKGSV
ncbi:MAG: 30S ribosomal protein S6 [Nitrospirae bacterium]|nr:30S ribosomal protein S6 [Nitrospirota bacterium]